MPDTDFTLLVLFLVIAPGVTGKSIQQEKTDVFKSNRPIEITLDQCFFWHIHNYSIAGVTVSYGRTVLIESPGNIIFVQLKTARYFRETAHQCKL